MFIKAIPDLQSHVVFNWESSTRLLARCSGHNKILPSPVNLLIGTFAQSFFETYLGPSMHPKSTCLYSGIKNILTDILEKRYYPSVDVCFF